MTAPKWKDRAAYEKLMAARVLLGEELRPYVAAAVYSTILIESPECPTMAIDEYMRLYANPKKVHAWPIKTLATVLYHEIFHPLRSHIQRWRLMGVTQETHMIMNHAADMEVNDDIEDEVNQLKDLAPLPDGCLYPRLYGFPANEMMEQYYHRIMQNQALADKIRNSGRKLVIVLGEGGGAKTRAKAGDWEVDCGGGVTGLPAPWELGPPDKSPVEGLEAGDVFDIRLRVAARVRDEGKQRRGSMPGHWVSWSDEILTPAPVRWEDELGAVTRRTLYEVSGMLYHTYKRLSRRASAIADVTLPAWMRPRPEVVVITDTSGSMNDEHDLPLVRGTVDAICRAQGARLTMIQCDAAIQDVSYVSNGRAIAFKGRSGTDMRVGIAAALALRPKPNVIMVITDGETAWPARHADMEGVKLIVVLVRPLHDSEAKPPEWARVVNVDPRQRD